MACWNRFDICESFCVLEWDFNVGGWLQERKSNQRRRESTGVQLSRIVFRPAPGLSFDSLSDNGKEIYLTNVMKMGLPIDDEQNTRINDLYNALLSKDEK